MAIGWMIAGGGTGGHVTPALALGEAIRRRDPDDPILFVGSDRGLEARLVPQCGFDLALLPSRPVVGRSAWGRARGALSILGATLRARRELARSGARVVLSVGGYAAAPAMLAAILRGTQLALVEPNARPGRANRLAARRAQLIFVGFDAAARALGTGAAAARIHRVGVPMREALIAAFRGNPARPAPRPPFRLLVFGGSQGARQINEAMMDALPQLAGLPLEVFHQTGSADRERVCSAYAKSGLTAQVVDFEPDMPARYRWAHLALCRAGALTVAELSLAALPALLVPYPFAADDHQTANARALECAGSACALDPRPLRAVALVQQLRGLLEAPERLAKMSRAALALARPDAADRIVATCASALGGGS